MNTKLKSAACAAALLVAGVANAHMVTFGWKDNGNGTTSLFAEHWHGDVVSPYSDNGGLHVYSDAGLTNLLYTFQWTGSILNTTRETLLSNGTLTGYQDNINGVTYAYADWFQTDAQALGNGTYYFFTGYNCCVDTMDGPAQVTVTGITSVPSVPEPGSLALLGLGLGLVGVSRKFRKS